MDLEARIVRLERELSRLRRRDRWWRAAVIAAVVAAFACQRGETSHDGYVRVGQPIAIGNTTITASGVLVEDGGGGARLTTSGLDIAAGGRDHVVLNGTKLRFVNHDVSAELEAATETASLELVGGIHASATIETGSRSASIDVAADERHAGLAVDAGSGSATGSGR
jgi:hypothetical protein